MSKVLTKAYLLDQMGDQQVEIIVAYPKIAVRWVERGTLETGRISSDQSIVWHHPPSREDLSAQVLRICCSAELFWARKGGAT